MCWAGEYRAQQYSGPIVGFSPHTLVQPTESSRSSALPSPNRAISCPAGGPCATPPMSPAHFHFLPPALAGRGGRGRDASACALHGFHSRRPARSHTRAVSCVLRPPRLSRPTWGAARWQGPGSLIPHPHPGRAPAAGFLEQTHLGAGKHLSLVGGTHCTRSWARGHGTGN